MDDVHVAPRVLEKMKRGAVLYQQSETGEALVGVMQLSPQKSEFPVMYVLETISPKDAVRQWAMFEQGDDWQGSIFNWLNENWEVYRNLRRRSYGRAMSAKWDLPLMLLGDWHKQPGMVVPSSGDFRTAKNFLREENREYLLTPIVTLAEEADHYPVNENTLVFEDVNPAVRIDFWGIGRKDRDFRPLKPVKSLPFGLPRLPDVVWWLDNSERMDLEITAMEREGLKILDIAQYNADGMPPLETCFAVYRPGAHKVILAITPHTYPKKNPEWRIAPIMRPEEGKDFLEQLFKASEPVPAQSLSEWSGHSHALIDGIRMIEKAIAEK